MKMKYLKWLTACVAVLFVCGAALQRPVHIFMAGDSTMALKPLYKTYYQPATGYAEPDEWPERGWGQLLPEFFDDRVVIADYAQNGRSTRTFIEQGWWQKIMDQLQAGDYVVIQFGHNDQAEDRPDKYVPLEDYKKNLGKMVDEVRAKGATPILCTPVVRRSFDKEGNFRESHGEYVAKVREVAREKKVMLSDLYASTRKMVADAGPVKSEAFFLRVPKGTNRNYPEGREDNTHFNELGARKVAGLFADDLRALKVKGLVSYLRTTYTGHPYVSEVWVSDLGNGKYKNPVLNADYSDPDACRVGDDFYMTSSSFNCIPGLQILHSKDLVNWELIGAAIPKLVPEDVFSKAQHGNGVWAPSIRYHNGEFYIYYGDPDYGIYMTKTKDPAGEWEPLTLVKAGKGLIDACPLFDEDGQVYLVHAFAGSRAGIKSLLAVTRLTPDGKKAVGESRIIYDGHDQDETVEGPKFYKRNGYYYIFAPAGGVKPGWQLAMRSKNVFGPYERKMVMAQGKSPVNGPHQGAWVNTPSGEDWFLHFQDCYAYGRVVHLQPMVWKNDWPVIGEDKDGDGCGDPVLTWKKPNVGKTFPVCTPAESDEFSENRLGLQWQWHGNPAGWWAFTNAEAGCLSLYSVPVPENYKSLWDLPNLLLQKLPARELKATTKITFRPHNKIKGERTGLVMMGRDYAALVVENTPEGLVLSQVECPKADKGKTEQVKASVPLKENTVYLRTEVRPDATCSFSYSVDGKKFSKIGTVFTLREGQWIGAKVGVFCSRPVSNNDGGRTDVDWFRISK